MAEFKYKPETHGAITAIEIFMADDGHTPMATLAFAFGGTATIEWANVEQREVYAPGINAYTLMYDNRKKPLKFADHVRQKSLTHIETYLSKLNAKGHNEGYGYMKSYYDKFSKHELAEIVCEFDRAIYPGLIHDPDSEMADAVYQNIVRNIKHTLRIWSD